MGQDFNLVVPKTSDKISILSHKEPARAIPARPTDSRDECRPGNESERIEGMAQKAPIAAIPGFSSLGLDDRLVKAILELGYEEPTPIQREAIPPLLEGKDLVGQAATGTGKTAAFALPLLHKLATEERRGLRPMAIVLVPTRELAMQVAEAVHRYGRPLEASVLPIYGGQAYGPQLRGARARGRCCRRHAGTGPRPGARQEPQAWRGGRRGPGRG